MPQRAGSKRKRAPAGSAQQEGAAEAEAEATTQVKCEGEWGKNLKGLWEQGLLLDATIRTDQGRAVRAHMSVLAAHSPYMCGLLTSGLAESESASDGRRPSGEISLLDADHGAVEAIVACLYSGEVALTPCNAVPVIKTANLLQIAAIEKAACGYLVSRLEPETAVRALVFSGQLGGAGGAPGLELHRQCTAYVHEHFGECAKGVDFVELLGAEVLGALIASDDLVARPDEGVVLSAVQRWAEHEPQGRRGAALETLLPLVRFPRLPRAAQLELGSNPLLAAAPACLCAKLLIECFPGFAETAAGAGCPRLKPRHCDAGRDFQFESVRCERMHESRQEVAVGCFDRQGVLYHIATEGGTSDWVNPHTAGRVVASMSSSLTNDTASNGVHFLVSGPDEKLCANDPAATANLPSSWVQVDLGPERTLVVKHYALRSHAWHVKMRNWELQGAPASEGPWTTLRRHDNDETISEEKPIGAWHVEGVETAYRCFRIHQHGPNACSTRVWHCLLCSGIELYGELQNIQSL